jgi:hypothetical protein
LLHARLDSEASTRPGSVAAGCTIRVVLALRADPPPRGGLRLAVLPKRVVLRSGAQTLVIEME